MNSEHTARSRKVALAVLVGILIGTSLSYLALSQQIAEIGGELNRTLSEVERLQEEISSLREEVSELTPSFLLLANMTFPAAAIYEASKDSVVSVRVTVVQGVFTSTRAGSGFIYDTEGHVITNRHVVEGADSIEVTFLDGSEVAAIQVGSDPFSDLAVIQVEAAPMLLKPLGLGDSSSLRVGDPVIAIGNPFGLEGTLNTGVVSQTGRSLTAEGGYNIPSVIQIDAAINPGNSGGPLLNFKGEVVGITTAIASGTGEFSGVGFAIPSNAVTREIDSLLQNGTYEHSWLGVSGFDMSKAIAEAMGIETTRGWLIAQVVEGGPADASGLKEGDRSVRIGGVNVVIGGDLIIALDNTSIRTGDDLSSYLAENTRPGQVITVVVIRGGSEVTVQVTLGVRPPP